jgi:hypothetical protein
MGLRTQGTQGTLRRCTGQAAGGTRVPAVAGDSWCNLQTRCCRGARQKNDLRWGFKGLGFRV